MKMDSIQHPQGSETTGPRVPVVPHLSVLGGMHTGARLSLVGMPICVIGSAPHCDVILRDAAIAAEHLMVISRPSGAIVRALGGPFMVDGVVVKQGETRDVSSGMQLDLGGARLALSIAMQAEEDVLDRPQAQEQVRAANQRDDVTASAHRFAAHVSHRLTARNATTALVSAGVLLMTAAAAISAADKVRVSFKEKVTLVEQALNVPQLAGVTVKDKDGVINVSGFVTAPADRKILQDRLAPHMAQMAISNDVETGADIASRAKDLFRISGVAAATRYVQHGKLVAEVKSDDLQSATLARDTVMKDLQMVRSIEIVALPNTLAQVTPNCVNPTANRDALRLQYVVSNEPAYLKTADGTKYYVDGQLPTGHIVKQITDEKIFLDCGGVESVITF
jgi:type III secretion protein D